MGPRGVDRDQRRVIAAGWSMAWPMVGTPPSPAATGLRVTLPGSDAPLLWRPHRRRLVVVPKAWRPAKERPDMIC
jgi:hypothetical protein